VEIWKYGRVNIIESREQRSGKQSICLFHPEIGWVKILPDFQKHGSMGAGEHGICNDKL
jgi:hypothetical protein